VTEIANGAWLQLFERAKEDKVQSLKNTDRMGRESHYQDVDTCSVSVTHHRILVLSETVAPERIADRGL
jgi:hypothetical protein